MNTHLLIFVPVSRSYRSGKAFWISEDIQRATCSKWWDTWFEVRVSYNEVALCTPSTSKRSLWLDFTSTKTHRNMQQTLKSKLTQCVSTWLVSHYCNSILKLQKSKSHYNPQITKAELVYQTSVIPVWSFDLLRDLVQLVPWYQPCAAWSMFQTWDFKSLVSSRLKYYRKDVISSIYISLIIHNIINNYQENPWGYISI